MDKRTLFAFVLMFLVIFGWNALFGPKSSPPDEAEQNAEIIEESRPPVAESAPPAIEETIVENAPEPRESFLAEDGMTDRGFPMEAAENGTVIVVENGLYRAEIDPVGGDLRSWTLKEFQTSDGRDVELINERTLDGTPTSAHALKLLFPGEALDFRKIRFDADRAKLTLDEENPQADLVLSAVAGDGRRIELSYHFQHGFYGFDVDAVYWPGADPGALPLELQVEWPGGVASSEPDTVREYQEFKAVARVGEDIHKKSFKDLSKNGGEKGRAVYEGTISWAGVISQYFSALVVLPKPESGQVVPGTVRFDGDHARNLQTARLNLPVHRDRAGRISYSVFLGPLDYEILSRYDGAPYESELTRVIDLGPSLFRPVARLTLWSLNFLYGFIPNYGIVIILFSAFTKLIFYPLTKSSTLSMKRMQEVQPELQALKEKYKDDQQKQSQEMFAIYRKHGINPMGSCLPLLVQMPVFIALFNVLRKTIEMRQAGFFGWINDLSRPDVLFHLPVSLPILGDNFCVLPILMAVGMWAQTKLTPTPSMGGGGMAAQAKMMGTMMPIMMFVIFYNSPSGLVLYWFVNTVLTALQTWRIHQKVDAAAKLASDSA